MAQQNGYHTMTTTVIASSNGKRTIGDLYDESNKSPPKDFGSIAIEMMRNGPQPLRAAIKSSPVSKQSSSILSFFGFGNGTALIVAPKPAPPRYPSYDQNTWARIATVAMLPEKLAKLLETIENVLAKEKDLDKEDSVVVRTKRYFDALDKKFCSFREEYNALAFIASPQFGSVFSHISDSLFKETTYDEEAVEQFSRWIDELLLVFGMWMIEITQNNHHHHHHQQRKARPFAAQQPAIIVEDDEHLDAVTGDKKRQCNGKEDEGASEENM